MLIVNMCKTITKLFIIKLVVYEGRDDNVTPTGNEHDTRGNE